MGMTENPVSPSRFFTEGILMIDGYDGVVNEGAVNLKFGLHRVMLDIRHQLLAEIDRRILPFSTVSTLIPEVLLRQ